MSRSRWQLAVLTAVHLAACERQSSDPPLATERRPEAEGPGFAIQVPKGFEIVTDGRFEQAWKAGGAVLAATGRVDGFRSSIVVIPTTLTDDPSTEAFCEKVAQEIPSGMPGVDLLRHQRVELPFGSTCQYEVARHDRATEGAIGTIVSHGDHAWVVTCNLALRDDRARGACDEVLRTWKFRD